MKRLKVTSVLLSALMCASMVMTPVTALADETETPSETQTTEAAEENETEEEPEVVEDKGEPVSEAQRDAEDAYLAKGKCGKKLKWTLDKKGTLKITGKGAMSNYKDDSGKLLPTPWEKYYSNIKKIVVSKGVTSIGSSAFAGFNNLTSVSLPKKLKTIGGSAFRGCVKLSKISIPNSVTSIGEFAFCGTGCENIIISKGVTEIKRATFACCDNLKSVTIPAGVTTIGYEAFYYCKELKTVNFSETVRTIGASAFEGCDKLLSVNLPVSGLVSIGPVAFKNCGIDEIKLPLSLTSVGDYAFSGCKGLGVVTISKNQKSILPSNAFVNCGFVTYKETDYAIIGEQFSKDYVSYIVADPDIDGTGTVDVFAFDQKEEKIVIPAVVEYKGVKYKVTKITALASQYNNELKLKTLVIGSNVALIQDGALAGCQNLESVTGGAGLKTIGSKAFANCPNLKVFNISSKTLKKIGAFAFSGDKALTTLQLKKTTKLTKSGVKNSLKESSVKTVKVKKKKIKKYKKIFKKKNCGKKVKVKK